MNSPAPAGHSDLAIIRRVAREYLKPHWKGLAVSFLLAVVIAGLSAAFTFLLQRAIHALLEVREPGALWLYPSIIAAVGIARGLALAVQLRLINRIGHMVVGELQLDLFSRLIGAMDRVPLGATVGCNASLDKLACKRWIVLVTSLV